MKLFVGLFLVLLVSNISTAQDSSFYFTTSDTVKLYVRVAGKGKPCLFVHGGPGSTAYYYEAMSGAPLIEKKMQMIYYDQRGCGRSDSANNNDYSLSRMVKDMEELRQYLGIKKWALMGHSFAGILITNYARQFPKSLLGLFYIHATLNMQASMQSHVDFGRNELHLKDKILSDPSVSLNEKVSIVHNKLSEKNLWYKLMYRNAFEKEFNDSVTFSIPKFNREFAAKCWGIKEYWLDYTSKTASIKCPVLVMTGDKDYAIGVDHYKLFNFPNKKVVRYMGGHAPFQEEPQWYAEKIIAFAAKL